MKPLFFRATRVLLVTTALAGASLAIAGCSSDEPEKKAFTIAWMPKEQGNSVFDLGKTGAFAAAAQLKSTTGDDVSVLYLAPTGVSSKEKVDGQIKLVKDAIAQKVSAIAISCNDGISLQPVLDEAVASGIPVMTWDSDAPASKRFTYYGIDNRAAGAAGAQVLGKLVGDIGAVGVLSGTKGAANLDQRVEGFLNEMGTNHAQITVAAKVYCDDDPPTCAKAVEATMAANPNIKGWFFAGLWPLVTTSETVPGETAMPTWEKASKAGTLKTVAFDTLPFQLAILKEGRVHALIGQKYYGWGADSVDIVYRRLKEDRPYQSFTDSKFDVVCSDNVDAVQAMWDSQDFSKSIAPCGLLR